MCNGGTHTPVSIDSSASIFPTGDFVVSLSCTTWWEGGSRILKSFRYRRSENVKPAGSVQYADAHLHGVRPLLSLISCLWEACYKCLTCKCSSFENICTWHCTAQRNSIDRTGQIPGHQIWKSFPPRTYRWLTTCPAYYSLVYSIVYQWFLKFPVIKCRLCHCYVWMYGMQPLNVFISPKHTNTASFITQMLITVCHVHQRENRLVFDMRQSNVSWDNHCPCTLKNVVTHIK